MSLLVGSVIHIWKQKNFLLFICKLKLPLFLSFPINVWDLNYDYSVFSLPAPKSCSQCSLGFWHSSQRLPRVPKTPHWEQHTEIIWFSDFTSKVWVLFQLGIALFLRMKRNRHLFFLQTFHGPDKNGPPCSAELSQNKHLDGSVQQIYRSVHGEVNTIELLRAVT